MAVILQTKNIQPCTCILRKDVPNSSYNGGLGMRSEEEEGVALDGEIPWKCHAKRARMDQDVESMAADRAQWWDLLTLLVSYCT